MPSGIFEEDADYDTDDRGDEALRIHGKGIGGSAAGNRVHWPSCAPTWRNAARENPRTSYGRAPLKVGMRCATSNSATASS